jgi:hypothetical protein
VVPRRPLNCLAMRKPFRSQNAAVTAAFFIAPPEPGVFIPLVGSFRFPPDMVPVLIQYVIALPCTFARGLPLFLLFSRMRIFSWWGQSWEARSASSPHPSQRPSVVSTLTGAEPVSRSGRNKRMQIADTSSNANSARQMTTTLFPVRNGAAHNAEKNAA